MARRKSDPEGDDTPPLDFEAALGGLESIVESMEHAHLSLEELVAHYEKGSSLLARCESILQSARERIELITLRNPNEIGLDAGTKTANAPAPPDEPDDDDDNDIRLF
jgi:exodeoxyribonuclease VII small subunit